MNELDRKEVILKLIVEHFVKTGEPVSSQVLLDTYSLNYSSATIRNDMAELENDGFIEKPYSSAGRVPSALGYRYYIQHLRQRKLDDEVKQQLQQVFDNRQHNIEEVIAEGCKILSQMTNLTIVTLNSNYQSDRVAKIEIVQTNQNSAVCLFVCESGHVSSRNFAIPANVPIKDLQECVKIFNSRLIGSKLDEIEIKMIAMRPLITQYIESFELLFKTLVHALVNLGSDQVSVYGSSNLLNQKELTGNIANLQKVMALLESNSIWGTIQDDTSGDIQVKIGEEIQKDLESLSIVKTTLSGYNNNSIAVIGSSRMDYDTIIEAIEFINSEVRKLFINQRRSQ
jgi:heat-inducible transcriptional repressor